MPIIQPTGRRIDTINPIETSETFRNSTEYRAYCGYKVGHSFKIDKDIALKYKEYLNKIIQNY